MTWGDMDDAPEIPLNEVEEMERMKKRFLDAQNSRELLAVHEAGHAVVAEHLNIDVKRVVLQGINTSYTETDKRPPSKEMLHNELVMLLAGYQAVLKETGEMHIANIHSGIDNNEMYKIFDALSIGADEQKIWMKEARPACEELIDIYWSAIKKIAAVLEQNGQMWGTDVRKAISEK
jgi:hypothetical protein